jgi:uncharacterized protein YjaZ
MKFKVLIPIFTILILYFCFNKVVNGQDTKQDTVPAKIIELDKGCKLVLDSTINLADSVSMEIIETIGKIMPRIQELIPADSITINLTKSSENILPMFGMGGGSTNNRVDFYFDPKNANFKVPFMLHSLAHELLHVTRLRMPHWQLTMLECMITEGIADHFMIEVFNCEKPKWSQALTEEEIEQYMIKLKPIMNMIHESWTTEFNEKYFVPWMFGRTGNDPIPGWTGYSLGWRIVENYLKAHPEARASTLVFKSAEDIADSTPELAVPK